MARRKGKGGWQVILLLVIAAGLWLYEQWGGGISPRPAGNTPAAPATAQGGYEVHGGCTLVAHRGNDGDSFHVRLPDGRTEQFRLYFVDAPESEFRSYSGGRTNHERIREQAEALGLTPAQAVEIGQQAKERVNHLLSAAAFTLYTRWEDPFGDRRYHAFIRTPSGPWLHETLVREGLVRIHTKPADLPDGTPAKTRLAELRRLEAEAKKSARGAWAKTSR